MDFIPDMKEIERKTSAIYTQMLGSHAGDWGMDLHDWDWVPGVGLISILEYYEQCKQEDILQQLVAWVERNRSKAAQKQVINAMAPYAIFPALYLHTRDQWYLDMAEGIGRWLLSEAPRTREGAFEHTVTEKDSFPEQVWADTVFMAVLFLARLARLTGSKVYAAEALKQLKLHLVLLQDEDTGVLYHGWNCMARDHMSSARWTRANAWIAVGTPMILKELKGLTESEQEILDRYGRMMQGLLRFQQKDGLWATVMDRQDFYPETSGSAGIAAGLLKARRMGLLDDSALEAAHRTVRAVLTRIDTSGTVSGVSGGTPVMPSVETYNDIPCFPTLYGQGLTLMLLSEVLQEGHTPGL